MKKIISAALITAAVAQPALARDAREAADRKDVAQAQSDADNMSSIEAGTLRARVILSELVLKELHGNQWLMDQVNADHSRNLRTIPLGILRAGVPLAAGIATIYFHNKEEWAAWDKQTRQSYEVIADKRRELAALQTKIQKDLSPADKTAQEAARLEATKGLQETIDTEVKNVLAEEARRPFWVRAQKPLRVWLGPVVGAALILDGATAAAQLVIDPAYADDIEARLTRFVEDANDTLARR